MPTLLVEAQNICGQPSDFVLFGLEPKEEESTMEQLGEDCFVMPLFSELHGEWHNAVTIREPTLVDPGVVIQRAFEVDYDVRKLRWVAPSTHSRRWFLRVLRWGDHNLLKQPGPLL